MITIQKGQNIKEDKNVIVVSDSGTYSDYDLIICEDMTDPTRPQMSFQAQYIAYGPLIYQFGDRFEELGKEILALDPASNHDAVMYFKDEEVRRIRREGGILRPESPTENVTPESSASVENNVVSDAPTANTGTTPTEGSPVTAQQIEQVDDASVSSSSQTPASTTSSDPIATSTESVIEEVVASSTPPVTPEVIDTTLVEAPSVTGSTTTTEAASETVGPVVVPVEPVTDPEPQIVSTSRRRAKKIVA